MALKALNLTQIIEFQSPRDPDKGTDQATKFKIAAIPSRIYVTLKDKAASFVPDQNSPDGVKAEFNGNLIAYEIVRWGLKGVENFPVEYKTRKEKLGPYSYDVVDDDFMSALDIETIRELHEAIDKLCTISEETVKNSEG